MVTYVFTHLGEAGYVLSLAPASAVLAAVAVGDMRHDAAAAVAALRSRGHRWLPRPTLAGAAVGVLLTLALVGWNAQAFLRGVGPGRLPDLRARDAILRAQVDYLRQLPSVSTLILDHDTLRQMQF